MKLMDNETEERRLITTDKARHTMTKKEAKKAVIVLWIHMHKELNNTGREKTMFKLEKARERKTKDLDQVRRIKDQDDINLCA